METQKTHWENVYQAKLQNQVSWFQPHLEKSLELIALVNLSKDSKIIDAGGGASTLPDDLLAKGYDKLTIWDISSEALKQSQKRLGEKSKQIKWIDANILKADFQNNSFDLWHDRAVFHFLTKAEDRKTYLKILNKSLNPGGFVIIASFGLEGPLKCSGLEVFRYSPASLSSEIGSNFLLLKNATEDHHTPFGTVQKFVYCLFQRKK